MSTAVASRPRRWQTEHPTPAKAPMNTAPHRDLQPATRPEKKSALAVDSIARSYGAVQAVAGISLDMTAGEIVALVGHSGSGKSTLLRLIAGLEQPTSGSIAIDGREVCGNGCFVPPEERGVGMMFQDYALFPHLSVVDNVRFGLNKVPRREAIDRAHAALERIGLGPRVNAYPHTLSGGEQQRVALARALLPAPRILLMDEPFSNLDRRTRDHIRDETASILRESGTTAILVTHDPEDAMRMADRIMLMEAGRVAQGGTAEELYRKPGSLLVARFFADFNEIDATVRNGRVATALGSFRAAGMSDGQPATICIRPHDLTLGAPDAGAIPAILVGRAFVGDELLLSLAVPGLDLQLQARAPIHTDATVGQPIGITLADDDVLVFPASN